MSTLDASLQRSPRPRELQDALNFHLYHPLAWKLAKGLASTPVTPNMVSIVGGLCVVAAAAAYAVPAWPLSAICGLLLHMSWHVVDGADGDLARLTQRSSPLGELIDGVCDYASHVVLYLVLAVVLQAQIDAALAWTAAVSAGVSHIVQSNHFEVQRRQYQWWAYGTPWLRNADAGELAGKSRFAVFSSAYLSLASSLSPQARRIDMAIEQAGNPTRLNAVRTLIRDRSAELLPRFQLLSNNHRTIMLGLSMLAGSPLYYFVYEASVLNLVLVRSIRRSNAAASRLGDAIDQLPSTLR